MLSLVDLHKRFGDVLALDGAGYEVRPGRILGFLGPNGAGKTTAMRCILGLVRPDQGEVLWNRRPVNHADRLHFGYMPEERGLYPKMKIREQLVYFGRLSGLASAVAKQAADAWLLRLGLIDRADSKLEELSHGNQQRVQLAVSLVHNPKLAVLDEPFSGLDPLGVEDMASVLEELADDGVGIVFSSHQLDLVEDVCQDIVVIDRGRIVLSGQLDALRNGSEQRYLRVQVDGRDWIRQIPGAEISVSSRGRKRYLVDGADRVAGMFELARKDGEVTTFSLEPPSLSDLFREAVRP